MLQPALEVLLTRAVPPREGSVFQRGVAASAVHPVPSRLQPLRVGDTRRGARTLQRDARRFVPRKRANACDFHTIAKSQKHKAPGAMGLGAPGDVAEDADSGYDYRKEGIMETVKARWGWLAFFFAGLIIAAVVVEAFEDVLKKEVELSYFVPLLIGHGGNTGSQSVATVIRALAMKQVSTADLLVVVAKEASAGIIMGSILGAFIFLLSFVWSGISPAVGLTVGIALPVVSLWANALGGVLPILASRFGQNPAVTSAPLMTTIVDSSGLIIYFYIAKWLLNL